MQDLFWILFLLAVTSYFHWWNLWDSREWKMTSGSATFMICHVKELLASYKWDISWSEKKNLENSPDLGWIKRTRSGIKLIYWVFKTFLFGLLSVFIKWNYHNCCICVDLYKHYKKLVRLNTVFLELRRVISDVSSNVESLFIWKSTRRTNVGVAFSVSESLSLTFTEGILKRKFWKCAFSRNT